MHLIFVDFTFDKLLVCDSQSLSFRSPSFPSIFDQPRNDNSYKTNTLAYMYIIITAYMNY